MRSHTFGATGLTLPLIGQGTWMLEQSPRNQGIEALRTGFDLGLTLVDTAEMYGDGEAEEITGEAVRGWRDRIFLVSKVLPSNASYDGTRRACHNSLRRLGTGYLDLYLLHWPGAYPIAETVRALESLIDEKLIRYMGVSNFDVRDMDGALRACRNHHIACNQVLYHLEDRGIERRVIPQCDSHGIAVMGYSPFGHNGFPSLESKSGRVLRDIANSQGATPRQIALAFLTRNGVFAIPKAASPEHVRENAAAADIRLSESDLAALDKAFPAPSRDTPLGMI